MADYWASPIFVHAIQNSLLAHRQVSIMVNIVLMVNIVFVGRIWNINWKLKYGFCSIIVSSIYIFWRSTSCIDIRKRQKYILFNILVVKLRLINDLQCLNSLYFRLREFGPIVRLSQGRQKLLITSDTELLHGIYSRHFDSFNVRHVSKFIFIQNHNIKEMLSKIRCQTKNRPKWTFSR